MDNTKLKSGFQSSEFYVTLLSSGVGLGIMLGYITPEQGKVLQENAKVLIDSLEVAAGAVLTIIPVVVYIASRANLKIQHLASSNPTPQLPTENLTPSVETNPNLTPATPSYIVR